MRWVWVLALLLLGGVFWWGMQRDPRALPSRLAQERRPAPDFTLPVLPPHRGEWGETFRLGDHLGRKPILINFWCYPACYEEAPILEAAWRRYRDRVLFVGISTQDKEAEAVGFVERFGLSFPNLFDPRGRTGVEYGMYGVPETFLIDAQGRVVRRHAGALDQAGLEAYLREVLP